MIDDRKRRLKEAAHKFFKEKGYKATNISEIAREAGIAVGTFYKFYESKEEIFTEVYVEENENIRAEIINKINWDGEPVEVVDELFTYSLKYTSTNNILSEWSNPAIADVLHNYYATEKSSETYAFQQFLIEDFRERLNEQNFDPELTEQLLQVYDLLYYIDINITEETFEGYNEAIWILVKYFTKGVFS